jgi:hypothetical protein
MAELLCGAIPGICGTVAMRPRGINGGIGQGAALDSRCGSKNYRIARLDESKNKVATTSAFPGAPRHRFDRVGDYGRQCADSISGTAISGDFPETILSSTAYSPKGGGTDNNG